jgi:hypothetical protein
VIGVLQNVKTMSKHEVLNSAIATGYRFNEQSPELALSDSLHEEFGGQAKIEGQIHISEAVPN